ncbi:MAG: hypothetical protein FP815_05355 [Desulfobulbaceae bacterium]|nr:hypothetical protein [Desulfobulbaceae bacterium]
MNVLVTEGGNRSSLAVTRSLGRRGCRVVVTGAESRNLASSSSFCRASYLVPDPIQAGAEYVAAIREIVDKEGIEVIIPMTEPSIYLLNPMRASLPPKVVLACPPAEKMAAVSDKLHLCQLAERLDVPIPLTVYLSGPAVLDARLDEIERYPVVVKPALSKIQEGHGFLSAGIMYASSREELKYLYETVDVLRHPSMIQEKVVGPGTGLFTLYDSDRHLALFSHRRLREKPPSGGVSVISESIPLDEEMVDAAGRLLAAVGWQGVAMVEFKRDLRDGKAKLMEINGRFWGSLQLAVACGVDFPGLLLDYLQGEKPLSPFIGYRIGHKLKWFLGTLDHLLIRLKNSDESLNLPPDCPSKCQAIIDFLMLSERNTSFDVLDRHDLGPFWFEVRSYIRQVLGARDD